MVKILANNPYSISNGKLKTKSPLNSVFISNLNATKNSTLLTFKIYSLLKSKKARLFRVRLFLYGGRNGTSMGTGFIHFFYRLTNLKPVREKYEIPNYIENDILRGGYN